MGPRGILLKIVWIVLLFAVGFELINADVTNNAGILSRSEEVDSTVKHTIFLLLGVGCIGVAATKALLFFKEVINTKNR